MWLTRELKWFQHHRIVSDPRRRHVLCSNERTIRHHSRTASRSRVCRQFEMNIWGTENVKKIPSNQIPKRETSHRKSWLTIKKGWFVVLRTLFSVNVCATSSFWMITSFFKIFIAYSFAVAFSRHRITLPNVPLPNTLRNSKFSSV